MATALMDGRVRPPEVLFDEFVSDRPDGEVWELIDGQRIMQAKPSIAHQVLAGNVERLLNDAPEAERARLAVQATTIDMSEGDGGRYVPDVAVVDADEECMTRNVSTRCYLAVEVVSPSDRRRVADDLTKIEEKVKGYRLLPSCNAILLIDQDRFEAEIHLRRLGQWVASELTSPDDALEIPGFGLRCTLADIYDRTPALKAALQRVPSGR